MSSSPPRDPSSILIIKLSSIGDLLLFTPALHAVRKRWPSARITLLTETRCVPVIWRNPDIDRVIEFPLAQTARLFPFHPIRAWRLARSTIRTLREERFDLALDFQGLFKSWFFLRAAKCVYRAGKGRFPFVNLRSPHRRRFIRHAAESYFELTAPLEIPAPPSGQCRLRYFPHPDGVSHIPNKPFVVLNPFTLWRSKKWPPASWIRLGALLEHEGFTVVVSGGPGDAVLAEGIAESISREAISLAGKLDLDALGVLLTQADCLVSVDSAPMHMAAALETPVVALFGPTDPARTGPLSARAGVVVGDCSGQGCLRRKCRNLVCMTSICPEIVLKAVLLITVQSAAE